MTVRTVAAVTSQDVELDDEVAQRGWAPLLDESVESWPLPARMQNWCRRNRITRVAELVTLSEIGISGERNLGLRTLADTRRLIEIRFGASWEVVRRAALGVGSGPRGHWWGWEALAEIVPDELAALPVQEFKLPKRMATYCHREELHTLADLVAIPRSKLVESRNLGLTSVAQTEHAIRDVIANLETQRNLWSKGLLSSWEAALRHLPPTASLVIRRRAGLDGAPETQATIGRFLGVTNVRVRQIETKHVERLRRQGAWLDFVRQRFAEVMERHGRAIRLDQLAADRWWRGFDERPQALDYFCRYLLNDDHRVVELDGHQYLTATTVRHFERAWKDLRRAAVKVPTPAPLKRFEGLAQRAEPKIGAALVGVLWERLRPLLHVDEEEEGGEPRVVAFGTNRAVQVLAMLRASKVPLSTEDLTVKIGRFNPTDEMIHFERGLIGVEEHFPDFKRWQAKVVPLALDIIEAKGPNRQWTCGELLAEMHERANLPEWIGHWHLASLLRRSGKLEYLGYLRFVLPRGARRG
jgi:hypothetical protein